MFSARIVPIVLPLVAIACGGGGDSDGGDPPGNGSISFQQDIQPLFQSECLTCHGGAGGLLLDT